MFNGRLIGPILVVEAISRTASTREILSRLMFADDLAVVAISEAERKGA